MLKSSGGIDISSSDQGSSRGNGQDANIREAEPHGSSHLQHKQLQTEYVHFNFAPRQHNVLRVWAIDLH